MLMRTMLWALSFRFVGLLRSVLVSNEIVSRYLSQRIYFAKVVILLQLHLLWGRNLVKCGDNIVYPPILLSLRVIYEAFFVLSVLRQ